jgi:hypothetical protein
LGYFTRFARALIGERLLLPEGLARRYPELTRIQLRRGGLAPRVGGWFLGQSTVAAITLGDTVFFGAHSALDAPLLLHEFRHAEQFRERTSFPLHYIWESLRRGYHRNCFEVDARSYAARRLGIRSQTSAEDA